MAFDKALPGAESREVAAHVETCGACRTQLDRWSEDPPIPGATDGPDRASVESGPAFDETLQRLDGQPAPSAIALSRTEPPEASSGPTQEYVASRSGETTTPGADIAQRDFLAPSDRAGGLGRLGPYEVLEWIGRGGMGVVFKALDERLNRIVAVKVLAPALAGDDVARRRFLREAQAAAAVCHEHVVTIHAVDEVAGHPYLVMQLVVGESLHAKLDRHGPLAVEEILRIGVQVASGLAAAHAQGLVHRDIKPANLLLENGVGRVKITDFGLARAVDDASLTTTGTIAGTPQYMSPEQARGEPVDHRTDLFSLGSVLYATCTGRPPFRADSSLGVLRKVSDEPPQPIREQNYETPSGCRRSSHG
jgi:serine/threonine protein kinase